MLTFAPRRTPLHPHALTIRLTTADYAELALIAEDEQTSIATAARTLMGAGLAQYRAAHPRMETDSRGAE